MRVLRWIVDRALVAVGGRETPVGWVPREGDIDLSGLNIPSDDFDEATAVRPDEWTEEFRSQGEFFRTLEPYMPRALELQRELLACAIQLVCPAKSSGTAQAARALGCAHARSAAPKSAWPDRVRCRARGFAGSGDCVRRFF